MRRSCSGTCNNEKDRGASGSGGAAGLLLLFCGTFYGAVGTEDAALPWLGLQPRLARFAGVKVDALVRGHRFFFRDAAGGTGDRGFQDHVGHGCNRITWRVVCEKRSVGYKFSVRQKNER